MNLDKELEKLLNLIEEAKNKLEGQEECRCGCEEDSYKDEFISKEIEQFEHNAMLVIDEYCDKEDIKNLIKQLSDNSLWTIDTCMDETEEYVKALGPIIRKLQCYAIACKTNTILENKNDFKEMAKDLRKMADKMDVISEMDSKEQAKGKSEESSIEISMKTISGLDEKTAKELKKLLKKIGVN